MKSCRHILLIIGFIIVTVPAYAVIDMRNANFSQTWTDLVAPSGGYSLRITRTYNSRSLHNGMFGFGWRTEFETSLRVTVDNTLRVHTGSGNEIVFLNNRSEQPNAGITAIMAAIRKRHPGRSQDYFNAIERQLRIDPDLRDEMAKQLHLPARVDRGVKYFAEGRADDTIVFNGTDYVRTFANGSTQIFDRNGHLIRMGDRDGNYLRINRRNGLIVSVFDNTGKSLQFHYWPHTHYVSFVTGPDGMSSHYYYRGEDLVAVNNAKHKTYRYAYNKYENMTHVLFPDRTFEAMTYNNARDWITSYRDRHGCLERYAYDANPRDVNHYSSSVVKTCHNLVTNKSYFSFWYRNSKKGLYLAKTLAVVHRFIRVPVIEHGRHFVRTIAKTDTTETLYHPLFGSPIEIRHNNQVTRFAYYPDGNLKSKSSGNFSQVYSYDNSCHKLSETVARFNEREPSSGRYHVKTITTQFFYNAPRCNLTVVKNSDGQFAKIGYDYMGRISSIEDQAKRLVLIKYNDQFGKPSLIIRPGLGAIRFTYNSNGSINRMAAVKHENLVTELQVANVFSNLVDLISPATADITNI